jgi:hypothetical protein
VHDPAAPDEPTIAFLCPNGHKLTGPASLQGKPGQCPHCRSKFVIPDYSDEEQVQPDFNGSGTELAGPAAEHDIPTLDELQPIEEIEAFNVPTEDLSPGIAIGAHPLAELFDRLWQLRDDKHAVQVHLKDGETIQPDYYAAPSTQQDQALFAVKNGQGTYMLAVIPWDAVARITVDGVKELPTDWFG